MVLQRDQEWVTGWQTRLRSKHLDKASVVIRLSKNSQCLHLKHQVPLTRSFCLFETGLPYAAPTGLELTETRLASNLWKASRICLLDLGL